MELEFDKEIDAIMRRARDSGAVASPHLDADTIAAFAENALPEKTRVLYTTHLADCGRCRRMLSDTMLLNTEADAVSASPAVAPVIEKVPWYQKLFRRQNLALAMGALILSFAGIIGLLAIRNQRMSASRDVSQASEPIPVPAKPYFGGEAAQANANAAPSALANTPSAASNTAAMPMTSSASNSASASMPTPTDNLSGSPNRADTDAVKEQPIVSDNKVAKPDTFSGSPARDPASPPPPPAASAQPKPEIKSESEMDDAKRLEKAKTTEDRSTRDASVIALKRAGSGRSGPSNNQMQTQVPIGAGEMSVTRVVSGKTFSNRDGAWYDSAYHGQGTTNVRRGTDEYKKLDGGLRSIADKIGGTVVVVWKSTAYRIQ